MSLPNQKNFEVCISFDVCQYYWERKDMVADAQMLENIPELGLQILGIFGLVWNNRHSDIIVETSRLHGTYLSKSLWNRALDQVIQGSIKLSPAYFQWRKLCSFPGQPVSVFHCSVSWAQLLSHSRTWFLSNKDMVSARCFSWQLPVSILELQNPSSLVWSPAFGIHSTETGLCCSQGRVDFLEPSGSATLWLEEKGFFLALLHGRYCGNCSLPSRCRVFSVFVLLHWMEILQR